MNKNINSFNIRVYGLVIESGSILLSKELIMGEEVFKFPGGGLEYGEGLIEGLNFLGVRPSSQNEGLNEGLGSRNESLGSKMKVWGIPGLPK